MNNWGGQSNGVGSSAAWFERYRSAFLIIVTVALLALGAAFVLMDRYQLGQAGALPARLDRFTGQVIACVPQRGCLEFIPAGQPPLATVNTSVAPASKSPAGPAGLGTSGAANPEIAPALK